VRWQVEARAIKLLQFPPLARRPSLSLSLSDTHTPLGGTI
jgi:hypothetical protein